MSTNSNNLKLTIEMYFFGVKFYKQKSHNQSEVATQKTAIQVFFVNLMIIVIDVSGYFENDEIIIINPKIFPSKKFTLMKQSEMKRPQSLFGSKINEFYSCDSYF